MTSRPSDSAVPEIDADFSAVAWVRGVRDQMYEDTAALSPEELIEFVQHAASRTESHPDESSADRRTV